MKNIKLLDCTLRDGGYYNNWDFNFDLVKEYLQTMQVLPIDIIEFGFRSFFKKNIFGAHAYTTDEYIEIFDTVKYPKLAVMIDGKDFIDENPKIMKELFREKNKSKVSIVRIAIDVDYAQQIENIIDQLKSLGYETHLNLMQINKLSFNEVNNLIRSIHKFNYDVLYIADSFGSMTPSDLVQTIEILQDKVSKPLGFHSHDNRGFALINALTAINHGVPYIDATVLGMGRGAGNLKLESLLLEIEQNQSYKLDYVQLLNLINKYFLPLQGIYCWGQNLLYHLSGIKKLHPSYTQNLIEEGNKYTHYEKLRSLDFISHSNNYKYDRSLLSKTSFYFDNENPGKNSLPQIEKLNQAKSILILANGQELDKYKIFIKRFIVKNKPYVISINKNEFIEDELIDAVVCGHLHRIMNDWPHLKEYRNVILPYSNLNADLKKDIDINKSIIDYGISISKDNFLWHDDYCVVPNDLSVTYAIACASTSKAEAIYFAGLDGTCPSDFKTTENTIELYKKQEKSKKILSFTPTNYTIEVVPAIFGVSCE